MRIPEELRSIADESAIACNAHVIDLLVHGESGRPLVEIFVDAEGPVTTDLCAEISRRIAAGIESGTFLAESFRLEVSSPGIERPLRHDWQYRKHAGRDLRVTLNTSGGPAGEMRGTLLGVDAEGIRLRVPKGDETHVSFAAIHESKVMPPW